MLAGMNKTRVTVELPADLLKKAQKATGEGVTGTIRRGLKLLAASEAYEAARRLRGKVKFSLDLSELRRDRR